MSQGTKHHVRRKQYLSFNFNQFWLVTCIWSIKITWYNIKNNFLHVLTVRWKPSHLYMKPCWVNLIFWLSWQLHSPQIWCYCECVDMNEIRHRVCHLWGWVVCVGVILLRDVGGRQTEVRIQTQSLMEINWKCFGWSPCQILGKTASPQGYRNTLNQLLKLYKEHGWLPSWQQEVPDKGNHTDTTHVKKKNNFDVTNMA